MREHIQTSSAQARERLGIARAWIRIRQLRHDLVDQEIFVDPAWDLLLDLYVQHHLGRPVTVSSACIAAHVPATTGLRWIRSLIQRGWLIRCEDPDDRRSNRILLTERALGKLDILFDAALRDGTWHARSVA